MIIIGFIGLCFSISAGICDGCLQWKRDDRRASNLIVRGTLITAHTLGAVGLATAAGWIG